MSSGLRFVVTILGALVIAGSQMSARSAPHEVADRETSSSRIAALTTFSGPDQLGVNVTTVISLQVLRTFLKADPAISMARSNLGINSHASAGIKGKQVSSDVELVLWGDASEYADGIVVQAYLTNLSRLAWIAHLPLANGAIELTLSSFPRHHAFEPIVLQADLAKAYRSLRGLKIYRDRTLRQQHGEVPATGVTVDRFERDGILLKDPPGWLPLPHLSSAPTEIADFTGSIVRLRRRDFRGAENLLLSTLKQGRLSVALRTDALIYAGLTQEMQGLSGRHHFQNAMALAPLSKVAAAHSIMSGFANLIRRELKSNSGTPQSLIASRTTTLNWLRSTLARTDVLFERSDPFIVNAQNALLRLSAGERIAAGAGPRTVSTFTVGPHVISR